MCPRVAKNRSILLRSILCPASTSYSSFVCFVFVKIFTRIMKSLFLHVYRENAQRSVHVTIVECAEDIWSDDHESRDESAFEARLCDGDERVLAPAPLLAICLQRSSVKEREREKIVLRQRLSLKRCSKYLGISECFVLINVKLDDDVFEALLFSLAKYFPNGQLVKYHRNYIRWNDHSVCQ